MTISDAVDTLYRFKRTRSKPSVLLLRQAQKGTIENPCTRNDTRSGPESGSGGPRRRLDDSGRPWKTARFHVASMWLQLSCGHPLADFPFGNSRRNSPFTKPAAPPVDRDVGAPLTTRLRMRDDKSKITYYYTRQKERPCPSSLGTPTHHLLPVPGDDPPVAACSEGGGPHRERAAPRGHPPVHGGAGVAQAATVGKTAYLWPSTSGSPATARRGLVLASS